MANNRRFFLIAMAIALAGAAIGIGALLGAKPAQIEATSNHNGNPATQPAVPVVARPVANETVPAKAAIPAAAPTATRSPITQGGVKEVTFDDIKLDMKKGDPYSASLLTDKVKGLDGRLIRIRGYILPSFKQEGITQFVLVRDNMECCFGPGAPLHDCVLVEMIPPATATFTVRPVSVEGVFSIREVKDPTNGRHLAIYHLDGKEAK